MATCFAQIFWGLLLTILDLNINGIDLLPDFIGYFLVALGCGGLVSLSRHFATARSLSWILVFLSIGSYFCPPDAGWIYGLFFLPFDCAATWFLLGGIIDFATARSRPDLSERAAHRRLACLVLTPCILGAALLAQGLPELGAILIIVLIVCVLVLAFLILHLVHRVKLELASAPAT